jgi:polysaccharide biosynthesis/export protein
MSWPSYLHTTLAATAVGLVAGCSTMPAFGPDANAITGTAANRTAVAEDTLPFEVVEVTAATLPEAANTTSFFPASFQSQQFSNADEVVIKGDLLEIKIWEVAEDGLFATSGNRETILNVQVSNSGQITVPYAGTLEARGLTTTEMRALLMERYQGRAVEPEIAVSITGTEARSTTLLGAVRAPGRITVPSRGIRLLDLIAQSGGASHAPWEMLISVQRGSASGTISLADIVSIPANNIVILPGDTVNVAHQPRRFAVYGGVSRSSNIEIPTQDATLAYLLAEVGGLNDRVAQAKSVFVFRQTSSGATPTAYQFDFSRPDAFLLAHSFRLQPNDITYVASADAADFQRFVTILLSPLLGTGGTITQLGQ